MNFKERFAKAEEQGRDVTRRVFEQWEDAERRIRASMRVHPRPKLGKSSFAVQSSETRLNSADPTRDKVMGNAKAASVPQRSSSAASIRTEDKKGNAA